MSAYLQALHWASASAANAAEVDEMATYDVATVPVSVTVISHVALRPSCHGIIIIIIISEDEAYRASD